MAKRPCPICSRPFDLEQSPAPPFCSDRCRQIDLQRWLDEKNSVPHVRSEDEELEQGDAAVGDEPGD
jgi:uncharacterized protein